MTETKHAKPSLLIRDIHTVITMDAQDTVLRGGFIYAEGGEIKQVGKHPPARLRADRTISARYAVALPGLINTHHHLCQTLTRACAAAADMELFDWLRTLYPMWARLDEESEHVAALVGMAPDLVAPGHCTGWRAQHALARAMPDAWVQSSSGTTYRMQAA